MKKIVYLILGLAFTFSASAQTTLQAGDIAFLGIQSGESGQAAIKDRFVFILLKDIEINTKIDFTDNAALNAQPVKFCKNEGVSRWTATTALSAGTFVSITEDSVTSSGSVIGGLGLNQSGDQVLAFQVSGSDTIMLAGLSTSGWEATCNTACGGTGTTNNNKTCLPFNLVDGINAVGFSTEQNNAFFNLDLLSGTKEEILAAINNPVNWTRGDVLQIWPVWAISVTTSIKNLRSKPAITLAPSISDGTFTIENTADTPIQISIHNLLGITAFSGTLPVGKKEFSFPTLPGGIYFAKTKDQAGKQSVTRFQISK